MEEPAVKTDARAPARRYDDLRLSEVVGAVRRHWQLTVALALLGALAAGLYTILWQAPVYRASALLVVVPPQYTSELLPAAFSLQGYQELLEADAVVHATNERLREEGLLEANGRLRVGGELRSSIFVSRRSEETSLAPMLRLETEAATAELAAAAANTWAAVFLESTREVMAGTTSATVRFIEDQYPRARERLSGLEDRRAAAADSFEERLTAAGVRWEREMASARNQGSSESATYEAETRRLLESFVAERSLAAREAHLDSLESAYRELREEEARVRSRLGPARLRVEELRRQLAETPPAITLKKAITDDALWQAVTEGGESLEELGERSLVSESINPTHTALRIDLSRAEAEVNVLEPRSAQLEEETRKLGASIRELERALGRDRAELAKLEWERIAGLAQVEEERKADERILKLRREEEIGALTRARDTALRQLDREINQERDLFAELAEKYNEALLAKGQQDFKDILLGAPAVVPAQPVGRNTAQKALVGMLLGGLLGVAVGAVREALG